jgi:hypothetical protein
MHVYVISLKNQTNEEQSDLLLFKSKIMQEHCLMYLLEVVLILILLWAIFLAFTFFNIFIFRN